MAKTDAERKQDQRARDKLNEEERQARLLSRRIQLDLYKATDAKLVAMMDALGIEEPQDLLTRLVHGASKLDHEQLSRLTDLT